MIVLAFIALGVLLRVLSGGSVSQLAQAKLRGETALLFLLVVQAVAPTISLRGEAAQIAYFSWLATFPVMVVIAWLNRKSPGMWVLGFGLLLNFLVITLNGGMPVAALAVSVAKSAGAEAVRIPSDDFVHVVMNHRTLLPLLADVIPVPGPIGVRSVFSAGDCLLFVGVVSFLSSAGISSPFLTVCRSMDTSVE